MFGYYKGEETRIEVVTTTTAYGFTIYTIIDPRSVAYNLWYMKDEDRVFPATSINIYYRILKKNIDVREYSFISYSVTDVNITYFFNLFRRYWKSRFKRQAMRKKRQVAIFKEELMMKAWATERVAKWIELDRWDLLE
jgi:hypothetical protein